MYQFKLLYDKNNDFLVVNEHYRTVRKKLFFTYLQIVFETSSNFKLIASTIPNRLENLGFQRYVAEMCLKGISPSYH